MGDLLDAMRKSISEIPQGSRIGVAFSGGADSSLLAQVCSDMGYEVVLLTVGFAGSHDITHAKKIGRMMGLPHTVYEINPDGFNTVVRTIIESLGNRSLSWYENGIAFYYTAKLACDENLKILLTANGIDELFCGYDAYRREFARGPAHLYSMIKAKVEAEIDMMNGINAITEKLGIKLLQPLLSDEFYNYSIKIPLSEKVRGNDDYIRKHAIRDLASSVGVPAESAYKRKKALQYGTLIHKMLLSSGLIPERPR